MFSVAQMKKPAKQRGDSTSTYLVFRSTEPWDTLKAQLLAKISSTLKPQKLAFDDYTLSFTVPRHSKNPLPLSLTQDFQQLLQRTLKTKKDPTAIILLRQM